MHTTLTRRLALTAALALPLAALTPDAQAQTRAYVLTTAGVGGTYYPVGVALATLAKIQLQNAHGIDMSAISSAGSGENIVLMREGQAQFAILQGLFGEWAREGTGGLAEAGPQRNLRSVGMLWPNVEHALMVSSLVTSGTLSDLGALQGRPFSIGARNSGTEFSNRFILENLGIDPEGFELVYQGFAPTVDSMINGTVLGTIIGAGVGVGTVTRARAQMGDAVTLLSVTDEELAAVNAGGSLYFRFTIPGGTYPGIADDVHTIAQPNFLAVNADVPEEDVYLFTRTMWNNLGFLCNIHPAACDMRLEEAMSGLPLPLHPGALRFYEESGMTIPDNLRPAD
jgi:TRAP transporter TAXI family solute receptor